MAPGFHDIYALRARALRCLGEFKEALSDHSVVISQKPRSAVAFEERGGTYYAAGQFSSSVADYGFASDISPKLDDPLINRGRAYEAMQDLELARKDYEDVLKRNPASSEAALRLYIVRASSDEAAAAKELAEFAERHKQDDGFYPIIEVILGRQSEAPVLAAHGSKLCETEIFLAKFYRLRSQPEKADQMLRDASTHCAKSEVSYFEARFMLASMAGHSDSGKPQ